MWGFTMSVPMNISPANENADDVRLLASNG